MILGCYDNQNKIKIIKPSVSFVKMVHSIAFTISVQHHCSKTLSITICFLHFTFYFTRPSSQSHLLCHQTPLCEQLPIYHNCNFHPHLHHFPCTYCSFCKAIPAMFHSWNRLSTVPPLFWTFCLPWPYLECHSPDCKSLIWSHLCHLIPLSLCIPPTSPSRSIPFPGAVAISSGVVKYALTFEQMQHNEDCSRCCSMVDLCVLAFSKWFLWCMVHGACICFPSSAGECQLLLVFQAINFSTTYCSSVSFLEEVSSPP